MRLRAWSQARKLLAQAEDICRGYRVLQEGRHSKVDIASGIHEDGKRSGANTQRHVPRGAAGMAAGVPAPTPAPGPPAGVATGGGASAVSGMPVMRYSTARSGLLNAARIACSTCCTGKVAPSRKHRGIGTGRERGQPMAC